MAHLLSQDAPLLEKSPELGAARAESDGEEKSPTVEGDDGTALEVVSQSEDDTTTKDQHSSKRRRGSTESQKNILEMVAANDESDLALFLPKRPSGEVSELLLGRLKRFMAALEAGGSLNASLKQRKNYRNPDFLAKMVEFEGIWEYGTVFKPSQFDPVSDMANSRDSFKGLAHELRALEEKRRQERTKVEFVTGWLDPKEKEREGRNGHGEEGCNRRVYGCHWNTGSASNPTAAAVAKAAAVAEKIVSTAPPRERERGKRVSRWD